MTENKKEKVFIGIIGIVLLLFIFIFPSTVGNGFTNPFSYYKDVCLRLTSPKLSGTVYLKNVPVHLEGDTEFTQYELDKLAQEIPDILLQNCSEIYICDFNNPNAICYQFTDENKANTGGFMIEDNSGRVFLNSNSFEDLKSQKRIIIHELTHLYDEKNGFLSNTQQVIDMYSQYNIVLREYAQTKSSEFLAVASEMYFINPTELQQRAQPVYDYFQSLFHYYS